MFPFPVSIERLDLIEPLTKYAYLTIHQDPAQSNGMACDGRRSARLEVTPSVVGVTIGRV